MVSTTVDIEFRVDAQLKSEYQKACTELGLTTTEVFSMFATKVAKEKRIPFKIAVDMYYSDQNMARLKKSIARWSRQKVLSMRWMYVIKA